MATRGGDLPPDRKPRPPAGPGKFANRQDLSRPDKQVQKGLPFGRRQVVQEGLESVPIPRESPPPASPVGRGESGGAPGSARSQAPGLPDLLALLARPTARPDEPITSGLPVGPGPGSEATTQPGPLAAAFMRRSARKLGGPNAPPELRGLALIYELLDSVAANRQIDLMEDFTFEEIRDETGPAEMDLNTPSTPPAVPPATERGLSGPPI